MDQSTIDDAVQFLMDGSEVEAAALLRACVLETFTVVDHWWDGPQQLDGMLLELACPRAVYEILIDDDDPRTKSIVNAFISIFPSDVYLKRFSVRADPTLTPIKKTPDVVLSRMEMNGLIGAIESQKACMVAVATGGPRINDVNPEYVTRRQIIKHGLSRLNTPDPNPHGDLWAWYGKWSDGSLPTYQSRRRYIADLYQPLLDAMKRAAEIAVVQPSDPTGWARVDRNVEKIVKSLELAKNEEDFQGVALLCREAIISLAQAVYHPEKHKSFDGVTPSPTDAKRMLENVIAEAPQTDSHGYQRKFARAAFDLAVNLQHRRTAVFRDAALCAEATRSVINVIALIAGLRDPDEQQN